jgi:TRAP-type C4-dicarboxylate transport system substrate-binding protein
MAAAKILPPVDPELRARYAALDAAAALSSSSIDHYQTAVHAHLFATSSKKKSLAEKVKLTSAKSDLAYEMQRFQQNQLGRKMGFSV